MGVLSPSKNNRESNSKTLNLKIEKIRLDELESFVNSETYKQFNIVPITPQRTRSYINNPNAQAADVVLYLAFLENKLIAFRTLFAGKVTSENQQIRFGWCSGNWVHPDFRRQGFSEQLLTEAYTDWGRKLMFTNYAPNSEELYLKTGWFKPIHQFNGVRGYLFPKTGKLIARAKTNGFLKLLFIVIDLFISVATHLRLLFFAKKTPNNIRFETLLNPDEECFQFNKKQLLHNIFESGNEELRWVFQFPWISETDNSFLEKYPFSSYSMSFYYKTVKVFIENKFAGYFIFSVREGHLKTLHFNVREGIEKEIANFLKQFCRKYKIEIITVYNSEVANRIIERKFPFLHVKKYGQKIYGSFEINKNNKLQFQDGDGDVIFT
ncbi:MAG: GNAT family N-acetyltransferase [Bacteroidetes bacterium]|nr:GNAT family N-acetyltransferase [Bacteroidota bacterium]